MRSLEEAESQTRSAVVVARDWRRVVVRGAEGQAGL